MWHWAHWLCKWQGLFSGFISSVEFERLEVIDIDFEHVETDLIFNIDNPNPVGFN